MQLGSILLVASGGVYLGIGVVNKIFGVVGYTFALAIFGTAVELLIIIWRIIAYIFNKDARDSFLPVSLHILSLFFSCNSFLPLFNCAFIISLSLQSIVVSLLLVVAHIAATVTTAVTVVVAFAQEKSPTHSPEQIFGVKHPAIATLLSITVSLYCSYS